MALKIDIFPNSLEFPSVKVIVKEIAYKSLEAPKKAIFSQFPRTSNRNLVPKIFQILPVCNMGAKHVQTDQGYQSHRLSSDLDTYM